EMVRSEEYMGWLLFETNQGTDDHIRRRKIAEIKPYESVVVEGVVEREPYTIKGGHVIFRLKDETSSIDCTAYEPTKNFRDVIKELRVGDVLEVYGGVREEPFTINIEKIRIKRLVEIEEKIENPLCDNCKVHMKSMGRGEGYRCRKCGARKSESEAKFQTIERKLKEGFYEVPPCARRHLSKPIKRIFIRF
ncbi:MAG: DNA-binding protein, partial [Thermoplasmata archaeon]